MEYTQGSVGRVFVIRFDHGDNLLDELTRLIIKENIRCAWFHVLGGLRRAEVVTGPVNPTMPPEPVWRPVDEAREVVGLGSVFWEGNEPRIHLHGALGHHGETLCVCIRKNTEVYLILEVYLVEISGITAHRPWYPAGGFNRLEFSPEKQ